MATAFIFTSRYDTIHVQLSGRRVITGLGEDAVVQSFPSAQAAQEHVETMLSRRRRDGYAIERREFEPTDASDLPGADEQQDRLDGFVEWDSVRRRLKVTFKGARVPPGQCTALVEFCAQAQPTSLQVICDPLSPGAALSAALFDARLPSVKHIIFDTFFQTVTRQRANSPGELSALLAAFPELESLFVTGEVALRPAAHPNLRELYLLGDPLAPAALAGLGECRFPELETLGLCLSADASPAEARVVAAALLGLGAPRLRVIDIKGVGDVAALLRALTERPLPASWSALYIDGSIADEDALLEVLEARAPVLGALAHLGLPLFDALSTAGEERAAQLVPGLSDREEFPDLLRPVTYELW